MLNWESAVQMRNHASHFDLLAGRWRSGEQLASHEDMISKSNLLAGHIAIPPYLVLYTLYLLLCRAGSCLYFL